jgi:hypothetical protein
LTTFVRKRLGPEQRRVADAPHATVEDDRHAHRRADAATSCLIAERPAERLRGREPGRTPGVAHRTQIVVQCLRLANRKQRLCWTPRREQRDRVLGVEMHKRGHVRADAACHLLVDRGEDLFLWNATSDERCHPA